MLALPIEGHDQFVHLVDVEGDCEYTLCGKPANVVGRLWARFPPSVANGVAGTRICPQALWARF